MFPLLRRVSGRRFHATQRLAQDKEETKTLYDILGVDSTASGQEIKSAFLERSKQLHPDVTEEKDPEKAGEDFRQLAAAYEVGEHRKLRLCDSSEGMRHWYIRPFCLVLVAFNIHDLPRQATTTTISIA